MRAVAAAAGEVAGDPTRPTFHFLPPAQWMNDNLFGVHIPEKIVTRLEKAKDSKVEGRKICVELIQKMQAIKGASGAHLMAPHGEEAAAQVIRDCGVLEGRAK